MSQEIEPYEIIGSEYRPGRTLRQIVDLAFAAIRTDYPNLVLSAKVRERCHWSRHRIAIRISDAGGVDLASSEDRGTLVRHIESVLDRYNYHRGYPADGRHWHNFLIDIHVAPRAYARSAQRRRNTTQSISEK